MAPTCEKNVQIKLTPKNFPLIIFNVVYIEVNETRKKLWTDKSNKFLRTFYWTQICIKTCTADTYSISVKQSLVSIIVYNGFSNNATDISDFLCKILGYW